MEIIINLLEDWKSLIISEMSKAGYLVNCNLNVDELTFQYYNIIKREISIKPRKIFKHENFLCPENLKNALENFEKALILGKNINSYQSRGLKKLDYNDGLLNDWGIHHFHLGKYKESDGFIKRADPLLFARLFQDNIYFIGFYPHGNWSKKEMIEIIHKHWPETLELYKIKRIIGLANKIDDDKYGKLRNAGISTMIELNDGTVYGMLGGGFSLSGKSLESTIYSDKMLSLLENIENNVKNNINDFIKAAKELGIDLVPPLKFSLQFKDNNIFISEDIRKVQFLMYEFK